MDHTETQLWVLGHRVRMLHTDGDYALLEVVTDPGTPGPPPHHHEDGAEFFYVVDGALELIADGQPRLLQRGESFSVPRGVVHTFSNPTDRPVTVLTGFSPRAFEGWFKECGVPCDQPNAREASVSPAALARAGREASKFGMVLAAPAPAEPAQNAGQVVSLGVV